MANAQDLYRWNPLQGQYSGYTNAIRAAQTMGTALDNVGVRLGDVGKMMADRYNRIQQEEAAYNTAQVQTDLAQIDSLKGLRKAVQEGKLDASTWFDKYGNNIDYKTLTDTVSKLSTDVLTRAKNNDTSLDYDPQAKQTQVDIQRAIANGDTTAFNNLIGNGTKLSIAGNREAFNNLNAKEKAVAEQSNKDREFQQKSQEIGFKQGFTTLEALAAAQKEYDAENEAKDSIQKARLAINTELGNLPRNPDGSLPLGIVSKLAEMYPRAVKAGLGISQEDFIAAVQNGTYNPDTMYAALPNSAAQRFNMIKAAIAGLGGVGNTVANVFGNAKLEYSGDNVSSNNSSSIPVQGQQQQRPLSTGNTSSSPQYTNNTNEESSYFNFNLGNEARIGGVGSKEFFDLSQTPQTRSIPFGSFDSHVLGYIDSRALGKVYNASSKGGTDYNTEFERLGISQGDARQMQRSYSQSLHKAEGRLEYSAANKIRGVIGLDNKGAKRIMHMLTSDKLPDKLAKQLGVSSRHELMYQLQNSLNGKNLKQAEEWFTNVLNPLLNNTFTDNTFWGVSADVQRRALETARQTGFNPDNLVNILSTIADGSLKGDELKTAISGLSTMTPSNAAYVRDVVRNLIANKDYLRSSELKTYYYKHLINTKNFSGKPLEVFYGKSDLEEQRKNQKATEALSNQNVHKQTNISNARQQWMHRIIKADGS